MTPEPEPHAAKGISSIVTRILIVLGAVVVLACAVLLILSLLERNHIGENAFLQEIADDGEFDEDFDQPAVRLDEDGYEESGYGGPDDYFKRSQLFIAERERKRKESAREPRYFGSAEEDRFFDDDFDYTEPSYRHELNREEEFIYRRPSAHPQEISAKEEDLFRPSMEDSASDLNDRDKDAVFEEMFYDIIHERGDSDQRDSEEGAVNQAPKSIRVKNVPSQQKLRRDSVKRVKAEEQQKTEGYPEDDE